MGDTRGSSVGQYALAVVLAALVAIVAMTLLSDELYRAYLHVFGR